jgi:hypothetical protein
VVGGQGVPIVTVTVVAEDVHRDGDVQQDAILKHQGDHVVHAHVDEI